MPAALDRATTCAVNDFCCFRDPKHTASTVSSRVKSPCRRKKNPAAYHWNSCQVAGSVFALFRQLDRGHFAVLTKKLPELLLSTCFRDSGNIDLRSSGTVFGLVNIAWWGPSRSNHKFHGGEDQQTRMIASCNYEKWNMG